MRTVRGPEQKASRHSCSETMEFLRPGLRVVRGRSTKLASTVRCAAGSSSQEEDESKPSKASGSWRARKKQMQSQERRGKKPAFEGERRDPWAHLDGPLVTYGATCPAPGTNGCRASVRADDVRAAKARSGVWVKTNGHVLTWPVLECCDGTGLDVT
jgi:hypothetical protein